MKNKTLWKQVGAAAIAAAMVMSTVPVTPVQAAGGKTLAVSSQKQLNQALKTVKGKNAVITVKAGKNVKITIPKGTYKVTIRVVGEKAAVVNNGTVKEIVVNSKETVAIKNNGTIKKVTVQNAKSVSFSGNSKKAVPVVVNAKDVSVILAAPAKITAKKDVKIVLKKGAEKSTIMCTKNAQAQVDNQTKKTISVKIADGTTLKVESGESCTITPKGKKEDTSGEDKTDEKDKTDGKDKKTDDTSDGNVSSGSSSGGTTVETPSKLTEADLLKQGYQLKWQDNFDGDSLNRADWNVELHEKGWVNNEWQEYVDSDKNIQVKDGKLLIKPVETVNADGTRSYTSGRINTQGKHDFKYGYFECRAKVPTGKGYLPAFWMMPTDENLYGQWPKCGEIDIMEVMGQETNKAYGTIHYGEPHDQSQGTCTVDAKNNFADQYHTYACDWEPGKITWYIDGVKFHEESDWFSAKSGQGEVAYPAPFDPPFYMILNLAVGGSWVGYPDDSTTYADQQFAVDYVKVYQKDSYDENVEKPVKNVTLREPDATGNYINNGDFSTAEDLSDDKNWKFLTALDGDGKAEIKNHEMVISTVNAGTADYSIQLVQPDVPLQKGGTYKVTFDAYADEARTMIADISGPDHNYTRYWKDTRVELGTQKKTYTYEFQMTGSDDANGRLEFNLGNTASTAAVHLSNVRIEKTGYEEIKEDTTKKVLADGNYVYNGSFQEGKNRLGYWDITKPENATAEVTGLEDGRRLKVVSPKGTVVTAGQQGLALSADTEYVLSFSAQANEAETMTVHVAGQEFQAELTNEKKNYRFSFQTAADLTDKNISFDLGLGTTVYLDDVRIEEDSLIKNGSFNAGLAGFEAYCYTPSNVTYVVDSLNEDNAADFTINDTGEADWHIQLKQTGVKLEQGQWYRLSLKMKSSIDRKVSYALQRDGSTHKDANGNEDWTPYCQETVDLTGEYQTITKEFQMKEDTDPETIFNIAMGAVGGKQITQQHRICIDDIVLEKIEAPEIKPEETGKNLLTNGDFSDGNTGWEIVTRDDEIGTTDSISGGVMFKIKDPGTEDWHAQLKQSGITLEQSCIYRVKFKVMSTKARTIKLGFMSKGYAWYGGTNIVLEEGKEQEVVFDFTMAEATDLDAVMTVSMGKIYENDDKEKPMDTPASDITLTNFSLEKITE